MKYLNAIKILLFLLLLLSSGKNAILAQCPVATAGTFSPANPNFTAGLTILPNANLSQFYYQTITQNLFTANPVYLIAPLITVTGTSTGMTGLPPGLTLSPNGVISGNVSAVLPLSTGSSFSFTIIVYQGDCTIEKSFEIVVKCAKTQLYKDIVTLPTGVVGQPYYHQLTQNQFSCCGIFYNSSGLANLPNQLIAPGLILNGNTGVISGIPTHTQLPTSFAIDVLPCNRHCEYGRILILSINDKNCRTETISPANLPNGSIGVAYGLQPRPRGIQFTTSLQGVLTWNMYGLGEFELNLNGASLPNWGLPSGLVMNTTTGILSGTPLAGAQPRQYLVTVTNGTCSTQMFYNFTVPCAEQLNSPPIVLPDATVGTPYACAPSNFGIAPFVGRQFQGSLSPSTLLPTGLYFLYGNQLEGTPITASTVFFTVDYTDGECTYTKKYVFTINPAFTIPSTPIEATNKLNSKAEQNQNLIKVYPNPSKSDFSIDFGNLDISKANIRVYDMQGKTVYSSKLKKNETTISLTTQPSGIYILEVEGTKEHILKYLIKE